MILLDCWKEISVQMMVLEKNLWQFSWYWSKFKLKWKLAFFYNKTVSLQTIHNTYARYVCVSVSLVLSGFSTVRGNGERKYYETWRRQLCILDNFLCMSLTLQSALNLLVLNSALLKGEAMPINSTLSFLLLFSINSSVNYSLLLQQLFLTVVIIIFCCCLFSWTDCLMPFLSLLCFFVICIKTRNAISIVSSIHSALSLSKKLVKKKKKKTKKKQKSHSGSLRSLGSQWQHNDVALNSPPGKVGLVTAVKLLPSFLPLACLSCLIPIWHFSPWQSSACV